MEKFENIFELPEKVSTLYNIFKYCNFDYVNHLTLNNFYKDNIKINEGEDLQKILTDFKDFFNICNISDNYKERTFKLNFLYTNTINIDFSKLTTDSGLTEKSILYIRNYNFINSLFNLKGIDDGNVTQIIDIWKQIINDSKNIDEFLTNIKNINTYKDLNLSAGGTVQTEIDDFIKNKVIKTVSLDAFYAINNKCVANIAAPPAPVAAGNPYSNTSLNSLIENVLSKNNGKYTVPVILFKQYATFNYEETEQSKKIFKILYVLYILSKYNTTKENKEKVTNIIKELLNKDEKESKKLIDNISDITINGNENIVSINILIQTFDKLYYNEKPNLFLEIDKVINQSDLPKDNEPKKSKIGEKLDELIGEDKQKPKDPSKIIDLKDENGRFIRNGKNRDIIYNFAYNCLLNTDKNNRKNCFVNGIIGTEPDSKIYHTLVNNIEVLRPDQLKALAWQLDLQKRLGRYESKKEWLDRYGNVMVERVVDKERSKEGKTEYKYGGAIAEFMRKNGGDDENYNYFVVDNDKEKREKRYKNCEQVFKFKCCLIDTLSNALNKNIYIADMKKDKDNTITSYNVAQSNRIVQNPYTIYNVPSLYWFMGGRYQFDENKTTAKELRRIYNNIKTNLESRNKIISQQDDESIIKAIDKIEEIEKQIGKILTNGFNYLQNVKDNNKKKITLDNLQQQVTEQATKALSMKEKLDKIVNYLIRESEKNGETLDDKSTLNDYYDGEWY